SQPADQLFQRACGSAVAAACRNQQALATGTSDFRHSEPEAKDYFVILRGGKGPLPDRSPFAIYSRACNLEWMSGCNNLARFYFMGDGVARDKPRAVELLAKACGGGHSL